VLRVYYAHFGAKNKRRVALCRTGWAIEGRE